MSAADDSGEDCRSQIMSVFDSSPKIIDVIGVGVIVSVCMGFSINTAIKLFKDRNKSPVKQRAPILGIIHTILISLETLIPVLVEFNNWSCLEKHQKTEIPFSRRLVKFVLNWVHMLNIVMIPLR